MMRNSISLVNDLQLAKKKLISEKVILDKKDNHIYPISTTKFSIPKHWNWIYLSDISIIQEGPGIRKFQYQDEGVQFLTVTNILEGSVNLEKSKKYISDEEYNAKYKHFRINKGDIVTACSGASWGKSAIYNFENELILNTSTLRLRFFNDLGSNKYLYYLTKTTYFKENLSSHSTGQQANYGYSHYSKIPIPLPLLEEQKEIVNILDKTFESIEKAKANIEKNIQNTKELFQSKLNEIFSQKGDGWEEKKLSTVCKTGAGGTPLKSKKEYYENGTIPWLCSGEVKQGNIYKSTKLISQKGLDNSSAKLFPENTVVIAMYGATAGDVGILRFETSTNQAVCGILPNNNFLPEFIYYSFLYRKKELISQATGNAQPNISQIKIKNTLIPIIDKTLQIKIVEELENIKEQTKQLEQKYQQKLDNLEELKKSILEKAFSGELLK